MAYTQYGRPFMPQAQPQWMPMYQQYPSEHDGTYKPTGISQTIEVDNEGTPAYRKQSFAQKHLGGLKRTLRAFAITAVLVLAVNVGWLGYAKSKYGIMDGYGTIKTGDCTSVKRLNTWFHLAINILSTLLLTGSNAFMAAYSGPTRQEIDKAHARGRWLHVGCVSLRNMLGISFSKSLVVLLLALSSVPFHLLYNSLIYTELSVTNYYWAITTEDFLSGAAFNLTGPIQNVQTYAGDPTFSSFPVSASYPDDSRPGLYGALATNADEMRELNSLVEYFDGIQKSVASWERLDQKACIEAYSNAFLSNRRNVVLVSPNKNDTNSVLYYGSADLFVSSEVDNNWWICSELGQDGGNMICNPHDYVANATSWEVFGYPVEYCLSEQMKNDECSVKFNMQIMLVVVIFNSLKVVAMVWILFRLDAQKLLTCVGDAAASFIAYPDQTTMGMCLADRRHIDAYWRMPGPRVYNGGGRRRWGTAISKKRWILFTLLMLVAWAAVFIFGLWGFINTKSKGVPLTPAGLASLGFGALNQHALAYASATDASTKPIVLSIIANIPQLVLALIYLMYMGVMTAMFNAVDWAQFAKTPQTLMVSSPTGQQRGTWLLGAPIGYGLGLLALQTLLHWFVSQSIFVVQIIVLDKRGQVDTNTGVTPNLGYSPIAIICAIVASGMLYLTAIIFMLRRLPLSAPPVVATCSAAISAACHLPAHIMSDAVPFEKLGWGATADAPNGVGHCSLAPAKAFEAGYGSSAGTPIMGKPYAGVSKK